MNQQFESDKTVETTSWNLTYVSLAVFALLVFYALSIGPVIILLISLPPDWLPSPSNPVTNAFGLFYFPLLYLVHHSDVLQEFYRAYFDFIGLENLYLDIAYL